jgi:pimeloyl-ACP methyl ester carboxylesterase
MPYPGGVESVHFPSGDAELVGVMYPAVGEGARPAAILLHGIPGSEKNVDIAYRLREMGWHTLIPHFRGTWGSGGDYDMTQQPTDAIAAIDYLLNTKADWQVDPQHVVLIGYSLGSRSALVAAQRDKRVRAVVSIAGLADYEEVMLSEEFFTNAAPFLKGASADQLRKQWSQLGGAENPVNVIGKLERPTLIVHGTEDEIFPYWSAPALYEATDKHAAFCAVKGSDHTFTQCRDHLVDTITDWLDDWVKAR